MPHFLVNYFFVDGCSLESIIGDLMSIAGVISSIGLDDRCVQPRLIFWYIVTILLHEIFRRRIIFIIFMTFILSDVGYLGLNLIIFN